MLLKITEKGTDNDFIQCRTITFEMDLARFHFLGLTQLRSIESFPLNSILFGTDSGFYVSSILFRSLTDSGLIVPSSRIMIDDESELNDSNVNIMREKMLTSEGIIEKLRGEASAALEKDDIQKQLIQKLDRLSILENVRTCISYKHPLYFYIF